MCAAWLAVAVRAPLSNTLRARVHLRLPAPRASPVCSRFTGDGLGGIHSRLKFCGCGKHLGVTANYFHQWLRRISWANVMRGRVLFGVMRGHEADQSFGPKLGVLHTRLLPNVFSALS